MRRALFRCDASPAIGGGHAVRCLALAAALAESGWTCRFHVASGTIATVPALARSGHGICEGEAAWESAPDNAELIVIDHYRLAASEEREWRRCGRRLLVIDDLADRPHDCDFLLDQAPGRRSADYALLVPQACRLLLGPAYALLRPEFARRRAAALARRGAAPVERVLIAPGATDPANLAAVLIDAAEAAGSFEIAVAIGAAAPHLAGLCDKVARSPRLSLHIDPPDMAELMAAADLCLGAAGGTSWERCCLGLPTIIAVAGPDQAVTARGLADAGAARLVAADRAALAAALRDLAADGTVRQAMSRAAAQLCDGEGARRVAGLIG